MIFNCFLQESLKNCTDGCTIPTQVQSPEDDRLQLGFEKDGVILLYFSQNTVGTARIISGMKMYFRFNNLQYVWHDALSNLWQPYCFMGHAFHIIFQMIEPVNLATEIIFLAQNPFPVADIKPHDLFKKWKQQYYSQIVLKQNLTFCGENISLATKYSCYMIQVFVNGTKYFVIRRKIMESIFTRITKNNLDVTLDDTLARRFSWTEASRLCRSSGRILPFFTSKNDILRMIAHLNSLPYYVTNCCPKFAEEMLAVYSGLILKLNSQVMFILAIFVVM